MGKSIIETPWSGIYRDYKTWDGVSLPAFAEAAWQLPEGPFPYWRGHVRELRLDR